MENKYEGLKKIKSSKDFLIKTGLVFEINRSVLHPLGLCMAFEENEMIILEEEKPNLGLIFSSDDYMKQKSLFFDFLNKNGNERLKAREEGLGFIKQDHPSAMMKINGCPFLIETNDKKFIYFLVKYSFIEKFLEENKYEYTVSDFLNNHNQDAANMIYAKAMGTPELIEQKILSKKDLEKELEGMQE